MSAEPPKDTAHPERAGPAGATTESVRDSRSWKTWAFGLLLVFFWWSVTATVIGYWPHYHEIERPTADSTKVRVERVMCDTVTVWRPAIFWKVPRFRVVPNHRYLVLATVTGALGGFIHSANSFAAYVGGRQLLWSWGWWYLLRPFIGAALALGVYFLLRAGLIVGSPTDGSGGGAEALNAPGVAGIAFLTGMFSKEAIQKLEDVMRYVLSLKDDKLPNKLAGADKGKNTGGTA